MQEEGEFLQIVDDYEAAPATPQGSSPQGGNLDTSRSHNQQTALSPYEPLSPTFSVRPGFRTFSPGGGAQGSAPLRRIPGQGEFRRG